MIRVLSRMFTGVLRSGIQASDSPCRAGSVGGRSVGRWIHVPNRNECHWCPQPLQVPPPNANASVRPLTTWKKQPDRSSKSQHHCCRICCPDSCYLSHAASHATVLRVCENDQHPMSMGRRACCLPAFVCLFPSPIQTAAASCRNHQCRGTC